MQSFDKLRLISIITFERSRKTTSRPCSGLHLVILYILTITRPHMDRGQQLMQYTKPSGPAGKYIYIGEQLLLTGTVHK